MDGEGIMVEFCFVCFKELFCCRLKGGWRQRGKTAFREGEMERQKRMIVVFGFCLTGKVDGFAA